MEYKCTLNNRDREGCTVNTRQLQYALELSKVLSFSAAAERLGISQPALSKQIMSLEQEIGVKLFNRSVAPMTVTPAGEHFFREAEKLLYHEDQLLRSMEDFRTGKSGSLSIGISPFRSQYLMPDIAGQIKEQYPNVRIVLHELGSDQLRRETAEGKYDLAIVNLPVDESVLDVIPLEPDVLVLAVPNKYADRLPGCEESRQEGIDFADCGNLPFVVVGAHQEMRQLFEKQCAAAGIVPQIAMEVVGLSTAWAMCRAGIGATLLPLQFIKRMGCDDSVSLLELKQTIYSRQPAIITRRGQYLSEYAKYAIRCFTTPNNMP